MTPDERGTRATPDERGMCVTPDERGTRVTPDERGTRATPGARGMCVTPDERGTRVTPDERGTRAKQGDRGTRAKQGDRGARATHGERGSALLAVLVVALLVGAAGLAAILVARQQLVAAHRRAAAARCRHVALAAVSAAGSWFEAAERGALVAAPAAGDVDRDQRTVDPDGDGTSEDYSTAAAPWNVRYREGGGALFRPPDGPAPADLFAGSAAGPDVVLDADGAGAAVLLALGRALAGDRPVRVVRVAFWGPPAVGSALATLEVVVEEALPAGLRVRARARGEVEAVEWDRLDRPVVVAGDAVFTGAAGWERGELVAGGDLVADGAAVASWPGGIPWLAPDRPLRTDADGDGTPDDADGDGSDDFTQWRGAPGAVPDPWWRARVGGAGPAAVAAACGAVWPFGPRAVPPAAPSKSAERSGVFAACPSSLPVDPIPAAWRDLSRLGVRGAWLAVEDGASPDRFRLDDAGPARGLADLLPATGGAVLIVPAAARTAALEIVLGGRAGAVLVATGDLDVRGGSAANAADGTPGDPRDAGGVERVGRTGDDWLSVWPSVAGCSAWAAGDWTADAPASPPASGRPCPDRPFHFRGVAAVAGRLHVEGPATVSGQVRAGRLEADGSSGAVTLVAGPSRAVGRLDRPGPPGAPRVTVRGRRTVP